MILVIDNYDSFVYNLVQYVGAHGNEVRTIRNDRLSVSDALALAPERIILSPGPCRPVDAGVTLDLVRSMDGSIPMLGVCLGHQAIGEVFGGTVERADTLLHGKTGPVYHDGTGVHKGLPSPFTAVRYHSLIVAPEKLRVPARVNAWSGEESVMGIVVPELRIHGVQYHPESLLTEHGKRIVQTFLEEG